MTRLDDLLSLLAAQLAAGILVAALSRAALPRRRWATRAWATVLGLDAGLPLLWYVLVGGPNPRLADGLIPWLILLFLGQAMLAVVLGVATLFRVGRKRRPSTPAEALPPDPLRRRLLLRGAALAVPLVAASAGAAGAAEAGRTARLRRRTVVLPDLPAGLDGLKILHISDTHLWHFVTLADLDAALAQVPAGEADLVCFTGDVADDLTLLEPALARVALLAPRLGCFACLGNHEYSRGIPTVLRAFASGPVTLLRTAGKRLEHAGATFYLVGIDDPRRAPGQARPRFYEEQIAAALAPLPAGSFTIALSHRPGAFDAAAAAGVALTLAGHTHGGQAAIAGHSVLAIATPEPYAWGLYERDGKALHVTCGAGHWLPVRLGCPPEIVMLQLRRN